MDPIEYAQSRPKSRLNSKFLLLCGTAIVVALITIVVSLVSRQDEHVPPASGSVPLGITTSSSVDAPAKFDADGEFAAHIKPALDQLKMDDDQAVDRAIARVHAHFQLARTGAPAFADSIVGLLPSLQTVYLEGVGVFERRWYHDPQIQPVSDHVRVNYEQYVTTGPKMRDAIVGSIDALRRDLVANRNAALQSIDSSLAAAKLPVAIDIDRAQLDKFCDSNLNDVLATLDRNHVAENAAIGTPVGLVAGGTAGIAGAALADDVTYIVGKAITAVVGEAAVAAGGEIAGGVAAGGAAGSVEPGGGTLIGAAAGLLAGAAVQWWFEKQQKADVIQKTTDSLDKVEAIIVDGNGPQPGLRTIFGDAANGQVQQLSARLHDQLKEVAQ